MSDDWRARITFEKHVDAVEMAAALENDDLEHWAQNGPSARTAVSVSGEDLFVYADQRAPAELARDAILAEAAKQGRKVHSQLRRWHPLAQAWEDADVDLPATSDEQAEEHARLIAAERADSQRYGTPEWEVKVTCRSRTAAQRVADRLRAEGIASLRRDRYLLLGAVDQDAAEALAKRLRGELGDDAGVSVEGTLPAVAARTGGNPFAVFGGLGA